MTKLKIKDSNGVIYEIPAIKGGLPEVTTADNGKILKVVNIK